MAEDLSQNFPEPIGWPLLSVPDENGFLNYPPLAQSVRENIRVVLATRPGEQLMRPEYGGGLENLLNEPNTVATRSRIHDLVQDALTRWEPRIVVDAIAVDPISNAGSDVPTGVRVEIAYRLKRTGQPGRVGVTLAMESSHAN
ncbi:MAG TPA: GPW/gp25 family protein [Burkholderiaceae bacterium]|nr:GPW/gp25 family protein [Burkholderiaceae bacterium]